MDKESGRNYRHRWTYIYKRVTRWEGTAGGNCKERQWDQGNIQERKHRLKYSDCDTILFLWQIPDGKDKKKEEKSNLLSGCMEGGLKGTISCKINLEFSTIW